MMNFLAAWDAPAKPSLQASVSAYSIPEPSQTRRVE